jgi:hypothetical protein
VIIDVTTTIVASGAILFVIIARITIHFSRNPRKGGSPPGDSSDVNIINFISVDYLFVITVWLINDTPDYLMADNTVSASVEQIIKNTIHKYILLLYTISCSHSVAIPCE